MSLRIIDMRTPEGPGQLRSLNQGLRSSSFRDETEQAEVEQDEAQAGKQAAGGSAQAERAGPGEAQVAAARCHRKGEDLCRGAGAGWRAAGRRRACRLRPGVQVGGRRSPQVESFQGEGDRHPDASYHQAGAHPEGG